MKKQNLLAILQIILAFYTLWLLSRLILSFKATLFYIWYRPDLNNACSIFEKSNQAVLFVPLLLLSLLLQLLYLKTGNSVLIRKASAMFSWAYGLLIFYFFAREILLSSSAKAFIKYDFSLFILIAIFITSLVSYLLSRNMAISTVHATKLLNFSLSIAKIIFIVISIIIISWIALYPILKCGIPWMPFM